MRPSQQDHREKRLRVQTEEGKSTTKELKRSNRERGGIGKELTEERDQQRALNSPDRSKQ